VFFTDTQQLTDDATQDPSPSDSASGGGCRSTSGPNGCNLYLYDFANGAGHGLIDASAGSLTAGGPRVQGVVAVAPSGSRVYFVAKGVLTAQANDRGEQPQDGANNLYLYERDEAQPTGHNISFVAALHKSWTPPISLSGRRSRRRPVKAHAIPSRAPGFLLRWASWLLIWGRGAPYLCSSRFPSLRLGGRYLRPLYGQESVAASRAGSCRTLTDQVAEETPEEEVEVARGTGRGGGRARRRT
jgi:hypothetical protein